MPGTIVVLLPLAGAVLAALGGRRLGVGFAQAATIAPMLAATAVSVALFFSPPEGAARETLAPWLDSGALSVSWGVLLDRLTIVMFCVVTIVSTAVHFYSVGYMRGDPHAARFMAYLSLFTFFMLALVASDNLLQLFFGWEGVGLASYLLIGFWNRRRSANLAAVKAFVANRVGDVGLALGIAGLFALYGTLDIPTILAEAGDPAGVRWSLLGVEAHALTVVCLLLFVGAMGKSAQLGLHVWLPDAMEGPTPVSALIHAATMVTAGVFLVCRLSPLFEQAPVALAAVALVGAATAVFAASVALVQNDIKRIVAYSTCSQLGYMFFAAGVSAYGAAMFHLTTHAFFKALLFLGAGSVITALHHRQDIRTMGGLARALPLSCAALWTGSLALVGLGVPVVGIGLAGFHSKDAALESAWAAHTPVGSAALALGLLAAVLTAFYSLRLLLVVFHLPRDEAAAAEAAAEEEAAARALALEDALEKGLEPAAAEEIAAAAAARAALHGADGGEGGEAHGDEEGHGGEAPREPTPWMTAPLALLAVGAVFSGALLQGAFIGDGAADFWGASLHLASDPLAAAHGHIPAWVKTAPVVAAAVGLAAAALLMLAGGDRRAALRARAPRLHRFLLRKWLFDEAYARLLVGPAARLGEVFHLKGDRGLIDRLGPDGASGAAARAGARLRAAQTGYLYHYALAMLAGLAALAAWALRAGGGGGLPPGARCRCSRS